MAKTTSFQADIRPLFTERDIQGMSEAFNLGSYDDVKSTLGPSTIASEESAAL